MISPLSQRFSVAAQVAALLDDCMMIFNNDLGQNLILDIIDTRSLSDLDQILARYNWPVSYKLDDHDDGRVVVISNRVVVPYNDDYGLNWPLAR